MSLVMANLFQDNMILQRGKEVWFWGKAEPLSRVSVRIQGKESTAYSDEHGQWEVSIEDLKASVSEILEISSGEDRIEFSNVAVGEVWLAGGQSNMEFSMYFDRDYEAALNFCENPMIRIYDVPDAASEEHFLRKDYSLFGVWRTSNRENLKYFSAAAWFFARALQERLQVPLGIIGCNWDGSRAACWMDRETLERCGSIWLRDYEEVLDLIEDPEAAKEAYFNNPMDVSHPFDNEFKVRMMRGLSFEELTDLFASMGDGSPMIPTIGPWHEWRPLGLYEHMLKPLFPFTMRGVIYYQGESDEAHPEIYSEMLDGLISCWRKGFRDELPFLMVQLAPFGEVFPMGGTNFPILRKQQQIAANNIPGVYLASTSDCGHLFDIHPKNKRPVGERLALLARGHVYGEKILCDAPEGTRMERSDNTLVIKCSNCEGGLYMTGDSPQALAIETSKGVAVDENDYKVSVQKDSILITVRTPLEEGPYIVRFAVTPHYEVNLYNMSGIPMKPFELTEQLIC